MAKNDNMKILEINKFYNSRRGADKHFLDVIALLMANGNQVAEFSMLQADNENSDWKKYFLSTVGYTSNFSTWQKIKGMARAFYSFEAKRKINAILDEFKPDLVHIHNIYHQMSPCILFEIKKRGIPVVMTVHDFKLINPNHSLRLNGKPYRRCAEGKFYQCFLDKCVKNSYAKSFLASLEMYWHAWLGTYEKNIDLYVAPSEFVKKTLTAWGMDGDKIIVLPHFTPKENVEISRKYAFSVAQKFAIYPGKISKEKGVDTLIKIFKNIKGMKLFLAGEVEDGYKIENNPNIVHLGFLPKDELREYVRNSTVVVSGSKLPETFGLIALEALENGKPFVGFDSGAFGEIIENGVSGFIVSTEKEFQRVIEGIAGKSIAFDESKIIENSKKYNAQAYWENLNAIFSKLISH
ncbi:MAG: Glycosyltransferase [uncultured bacterium]|nr:MAG: Glycosyltransferase [uncultured bacterium]